MITGKELADELEAKYFGVSAQNRKGLVQVCEDIANELNQRTCEMCANKKQCFQYVMIRQKTSSDILVDVEYKITTCSLYTKEVK